MTPSGSSFELRDGAKWHDGRPVTADDVVFTCARALDPTENVLVRTFPASRLEEVGKVDDRTVEFAPGRCPGNGNRSCRSRPGRPNLAP